jgi:hypothetical protein
MAACRLPLSPDELELALASTDSWVARLVCRAFRDRCSRQDASAKSAVQSVARVKLAISLGMPRRSVYRAAARGGHLATLHWACGAHEPSIRSCLEVYGRRTGACVK